MKKFKRMLIIGFMGLSLFACQPQVVEVQAERASTAGFRTNEGAYLASNADYAGDVVVVESEVQVGGGETTVVEQQAVPQERLIIRNGSLRITVQNPEESMAEINDIVEAVGGWVVQSNSSQYGESIRGSMQVRVPADNFNTIMTDIQAGAIQVENVNVSGQDVTDEFVDLQSRLGNLEATADRVRSFLDETENVEEALAVNAELSRLDGEIEVIKGRMKFLSESAAFSNISVNIYPDIIAQPLEIERWLPFEVAEDATEALISTMQGLASFLIWFGIYLLPVGLVVGTPAWFVGRWGWRKREERRAAKATVTNAQAEQEPAPETEEEPAD